MTPRPPAGVGIVGAGAMGTGIAQVAAQAGHRVLLYDQRPGAAGQAVAAIRKMFAKLVEKGRMTAAAATAAGAGLAEAGGLADLAGAAIVIEAIAEELEAKRALFAALEGLVAADCLLATNTSSLSITAVGAGLQRPQRLVGMHFFNPAPLMELVEVVSGAATGREEAAAVYGLARAWGKSPVYAASTPGFIVNRVARPYYAEALRLLGEQAAALATLDAVLREAGGFRMGPLELTDLIGQDVNFAVTQSVYEGFFGDPRFRPSLVQQELIRAGYLGRKTGRGFYAYGEGATPGPPETAAPAPRPEGAVLGGGCRMLAAIADRARAGGVEVKRVAADQAWIEVGEAVMAISDGRSAEQRAAESGPRHLVVLDLALDFGTATRVAVARPRGCSEGAWTAAIGLLQAAGFAVSPMRDLPAMMVLRTWAMLANEAADAVNQGVGTAADVDTAMRKGVNYPQGPLAWADGFGLPRLHTVLGHLRRHYGEDRYRISPLIRNLNWAEGVFMDDSPARAMVERDRASRELGMRILELRVGGARVAMAVRADMIQGHDTCHGGFVFALADSAFAFACNSHGYAAVAATCSIDYLTPVGLGDELEAEAEERALAGRSGVYEVTVRNQRGEIVALFLGRSRRVGSRE